MNDNSIEQIINELSKIESLSVNIKNDTERQRDEYAKVKEEEFLKFDEQLQKETEEQLSVLKENLHKNMDEEVLHMKAQTDKKVSSMEEQFDRIYVQLAEDIVERIIKE